MKFKKNSLIVSSVVAGLLFVGCGSSDSADTNLKGQFVDSPVSGLTYTTDSMTDYTDYQGYAEYKAGETCTFYVGTPTEGLLLGSIPCAPIMSPYTIGGSESINLPTQKTKNIARILQSLNTENNASTKIVINANLAANFLGADINISAVDLNMTLIATKANIANEDTNYTNKIVSEVDAIIHMTSYYTANHPNHLGVPVVKEKDTPVANGQLGSFGGKGYISEHNVSGGNGDDIFYAMTTDADGNIYGAGYSEAADNSEDSIIFKYTSFGVLDTTFNGTGIISEHNISGGNGSEYIVNIKLDSNNKIVVFGVSRNTDNDDNLYIKRYDTNGSVDTTFGTNGMVDYNATGRNYNPYFNTMVMDNNDNIYISGTFETETDTSFILKYTNTGELDTSFNNDSGIVEFKAISGKDTNLYNLSIVGNYLIASGNVYNDPNQVDMFIAKFNFSGTQDTSFGGGSNNGYIIKDQVTLISGDTTVDDTAVSLIADGTNMISAVSTEGQIAIIKYDINGTPVGLFGNGGKIHMAADLNASDINASSSTSIYGLSVDSQHNIYVSGSSDNSDGATALIVAKYKENGTLDTSFGTNGFFTFSDATAQGAFSTEINNGRFIIGGYIVNSDADTAIWVLE